MRRLPLFIAFSLSLFLFNPSTSPAQPAPADRLGVLVIAHGAGPAWNAPVESAVRSVRETTPAEVAFLMGSGSKPQAAYDRLVQAGATRVVVVPLLISSTSPHAEQIRFIGGARPDYPHAEHMALTQVKGPVPIASVTAAMDDHPLIADILADRAKVLSRDLARETLVIVAHGPNEDDEAAVWTATIERLANQVHRNLPFRRIEVRLLRDDAPKPVKDRALAELHDSVAAHAQAGRVVVVPLLLSRGSVADEIPAALRGLDFAWDGRTLLPDDRIAQWILARAGQAAASSASLRPQPGPDASASGVVGSVTDTTGLPIAGAVVILRNEATGLERTDRTTTTGAFSFRELAFGRYQIVASVAGFAASSTALTVPAVVPVEVVLKPAAYEELVTVVSAGRRDRLRTSESAPVTVLGGEAIRDAGHETVGDALREVAGVVTRRGSEGTGAAGEQIQGIDSRQVLVLIDGQPVVGARGVKSGVLNLDRESTLRLDRVEVVKGAASALYGSDAIGGVINLISRDPHRPLELDAHASSGSQGAADVTADAGGLGRWGTMFMSAGRHQRDSFDLTPSTPDTTGAALRRHDVSARVSTSPTPPLLLSSTITGYWNTQSGRSVGELGPEEDRTPSDAQTYGARAQWQPDSQTTGEVRAYRGRYQETSDGFLLNTAQTPLEPGDLYQGLSKVDGSIARTFADRHQLRGGVEWMHDTYRGRNRIRDAEGNTATTRVAWGQYEVHPASALTVTTGVRVDNHSAFGTAVSPKAAANLRLADSVSARVSFGRGFRAPDLGQLYYRFLNPTNLYQVIGNPLLQPERSGSWQIGLETRHGSRAHMSVNVFRNDVTNLIESTSLGFIITPAQLAAVSAAEHLDPDFNVQLNRLLFLYKNVTHARTKGVELNGDVRLSAAVRLSGSYAYLDALNAESGLALIGRNNQQGMIRLDWTPARTGLRANLRSGFYSSWIVSRATTAAGAVDTRVPGFALWDVTVAKTLLRGAEAFGAIDNLTNSQDPNTGIRSSTGAALPIYRPEFGRAIRAGVRWSWLK
ncbi:MAG: TonB-dependent receptor [Acidobacteria bacterium]|nr:TonB-dependent receptor [Acidobacteriota bacterium]